MIDAQLAIRTEALTKYYGSVVGIESLSLEVERGEVFGFLGANGAGKTTTIRLLLDLIRPTRGTASLMGLDCQRQGPQARKQIGYLPGELPIYPDLTGAEYLDYLARIARQPVSQARIEFLLRRFEISALDLRRGLRDQSLGMRRKLGIVQAMMTDPPLLIMDEPTAGLDPLMIGAFRETIDEMKRHGRTTIFLSSHILAEVERMCGRIGLIRSGRLVNVQSMEDIRRESPRRVTLEFSVAMNGDLPDLTSAPGVTATVIERTPHRWVFEVQGPLGAWISRLNGLPVHDVHVDPFKLEDRILKLYSEETAVGTRQEAVSSQPTDD